MIKESRLSEDSVKNEVEELHLFFQDWFNGDVSKDKIERFTSVVSSDFQIIAPNATFSYVKDLKKMIELGYDTSSGRRIWTENIATREVGSLIIATYNELQEYDGIFTKRISSALFSYDPNTPNECKWHHVHETWIKS